MSKEPEIRTKIIAAAIRRRYSRFFSCFLWAIFWSCSKTYADWIFVTLRLVRFSFAIFPPPLRPIVYDLIFQLNYKFTTSCQKIHHALLDYSRDKWPNNSK